MLAATGAGALGALSLGFAALFESPDESEFLDSAAVSTVLPDFGATAVLVSAGLAPLSLKSVAYQPVPLS